MSHVSLILTIVAMGIVTFAIRYCFIGLGERAILLERLRRGLVYVPPAVLSAIVFPDIFITDHRLNLSLANPFLLAALAGGVAAWYSKSVLITMALGMTVLWLTRIGL